MQIRKTYTDISPTLLFDEIKEFVLRYGLIMDQNKLETYSMPSNSSAFIYRGTLTFKTGGKEAIRAHVIGVDRGETKLMLDSDDSLIPQEKITSLVADLDFMLGSYQSEK